MEKASEIILEVNNLETHFFSKKGIVRAVDKVSFCVNQGEVLGVVGESGCGKSVTALSILRLIPPLGKIVGGQIMMNGSDLLAMTEKQLEQIRGNKISMIFQDPMTSLNPLLSVGEQIREPLMQHRGFTRKDAHQEAVRMLDVVGIPAPEQRVKEYPNSLSGGMRQRVMIAMALSCNPELLIADEPTTALDVTVQAQILELMLRLRNETKMSIMMITHDLGVVAEMCDKAIVMYCGSIMESGRVKDIFRNPMHPYTIGLLASIPKITERTDLLHSIKGVVPNLKNLPSGCRFADRCEHCMEICTREIPALKEVAEGHSVRCFLMEK